MRTRDRSRIRRSLAAACAVLAAIALTSATPAGAQPGRPAACPATTPVAAAAPLTAPTHVTAIAGNGSATVTWCAPDRGAGSVVSYTVTSSDGHSVTAAVPNQWAIVDGLTNGTAYRFTVVANTASGATSPAATSDRVRPAPIPGPRSVLLGRPTTVTYDQFSLMINGRRTPIYAGEFDPWRTPSPALWLDRLQKMKAGGYNTVTVYFDWDYASAAPGAYDFTGVRDMNAFLNMAQQAGLYVIARPGPYINAETDAGGIPSWLLTAPGGFRTDTQPYLSAALQWFSEIDPIIAAHDAARGGNVILYQIENEVRSDTPQIHDYMAALEQQARADGVTVPFTYNECCHGPFFTSGTGAVNISGVDVYPQSFDCAATTKFGNPGSYPTQPGEPPMLPEFQGGSFDKWGGTGYDNCYQLTGPAFENVYYKNNLARGITIQSNYMAVGGTDWGWLPDPRYYSSYDYGAGIRENGEIGTPTDPNSITGSKFAQNKLIGDFVQAVAPLAKTIPATAPTADNPAVTTLARANPDDGTQLVYVRPADAASTATVTTHLALTIDPSHAYPVVPQQPSTAITLAGRDAKLLLAGYRFAGQTLEYSTSELMTQATIGGRAQALLYGTAGTAGETVLRYASPPQVRVLTGSVATTWDATRGDLRLNYVHNGLSEVLVTGGGAPPLLLLLASTDVAEGFWPTGPALVQGGYLLRTATVHGRTLTLTGDTTAAGPITAWAPPGVRTLTWNGRMIPTRRTADGALTGTLPGPAPVSVPALAHWRFQPESQFTQPGFDDSQWTLADHPVSTSKAASTPVLYADDYGFHHGLVTYRGHFTATGAETGITVTADGIAPTGAFGVWLNGTFLGTGGNKIAQAFTFPPNTVRAGTDNVLAVLVEDTGHQEGPVAEPTGLYAATLTGSTVPITWRLSGSTDGPGPTPGADLPTDPHWSPVTLPDTWASRGVTPGIGWYRTSVTLHLPRDSYVPMAVRIATDRPTTANYRASIYVNGWLIGRYVNNIGPQTDFYVPAGILNDHGPNAIAFQVWGLDGPGGGLGTVSLVAEGNQATP